MVFGRDEYKRKFGFMFRTSFDQDLRDGKNCRVEDAYLYIPFMHQNRPRRCGHIVANSRPSDRLGEQSGSYDFRSLCRKSLDLYKNQTAVRPSLSANFAKKSSIFPKIDRQSNLPGLEKFANKILSFVESIRRPDPLSAKFLEKPSHFN
jgi:hypothetical protein